MVTIMRPNNIDHTNNQAGSCDSFIHVPLCFQETEYTCGVACLQSILGCYGINYRQDALAEQLHSKPIWGTDFRDILFFLYQLGFQVSFEDNMSIDSLKKYIHNGIAPMLMLQAWAEDGIEYEYNWRDAHYVIACGYENDNIIIMDPYTLGNFTYISTLDLLKRWHVSDKLGMRYYNSGLIIKNENIPFKYDPDVVKPLQ